jgi:hypothetical protein
MNRFALLTAGLSVAALLAGCGGTTLNSNVARIRAFNGATGTTAAATIYINDGSANGDQNYGQVSQYLYVNSGTSSFGWSDNESSGGLTSAFSSTLNSGDAYSTILLGRADLQLGTSSPFLDITEDDQTAPPSGDSRIRIIPDAPDAGSVDVYINGSLQQAAFAYPGTTITGIPSGITLTAEPFSLQQFTYFNVRSGNVSVEFKEAGTSTVVAGPTNLNVSEGSRYSIFLMEPTVPPTVTYSIQQISDAL